MTELVSATSISDQKAALRAEALARRDAMAPAERAAAAEAAAQRLLPVAVTPGMTVAGFSAIRSEISPVPLMKRFVAAGAALVLPAIAGRGRPLIFRRWSFGDPLDRGQWGIREPKPGAGDIDPDVLIVPLAAFDRRGHRIGYGAGYYDLTIAALRARKTIVALGLAFALQEIAAVPDTPRDARLDFVVTERETIDCRA